MRVATLLHGDALFTIRDYNTAIRARLEDYKSFTQSAT